VENERTKIFWLNIRILIEIIKILIDIIILIKIKILVDFIRNIVSTRTPFSRILINPKRYFSQFQCMYIHTYKHIYIYIFIYMYVYIQGVKHRRTSGASVVQAHPIFTWPDHWIFSPGNTFGIQRNVRRRDVSRRTKCIQGVVDQQALWFRYTQINQRKSELTNVSTTFIFNQRSIKVVSARFVLCTRNSRYRNSRDRMFVLKFKNMFFSYVSNSFLQSTSCLH